jgi:cytochrome c peroxidase
VVSVEINDLPKEEGWDVWLIDSVAGRSIMPEPDDAMLRIGSLKHEGKLARFEANLGSDAFGSFDMDLIIVTKAGKNPSEDRTMVGTTSLFHRVYRSAQRGQFGVLADADPLAPAPDKRGVLQQMFDTISPTASAQIGPIPNPSTPQEILITAGRQSFFNDTFNGNGRTCGTCHRENNNLTIDAEFIETLPPNDPLFVAEFTPALSANFENPRLMRKFGLILENPDGFGDLANRFVMRGVPHTLALLQNTLTPVAGGADGTTIPPNERTGWGGDGAPGTGTLREFIIGAITQHYPKTLARQAGSDFILPTVAQLDALEAFQRSTGRRQDLVLQGPGALSLKSEVAAKGQEIFNNGGSLLGGSNEGAGKCFFCHLNAGASDFFFPGQNANFNTNVEQLPSQPADLVQPPQLNPADGGFGQGTPPPGVFGIGNGTFNSAVLVEAADTGPFFHNNSITTIEGAVDFYNSEAFNNAPGFGSLIGGIRLEATEVEAVAAFLRVINALENIRSSIDLEDRAKVAASFSQAQELLRLSISELEDAIEVLDCGNLHPNAVRGLREALAIDAVAVATSNQFARNVLINQAIQRKNQAKAIMVN